MSRSRLIAASAAIGLALAGCSDSSTSSLFKPSPPPTQALQFESVPPGADVRTADGQTCRTPCSLAVPLTAQSVNFAMNGYVPQTVPVAVHQDNVFSPTVFAPNPVAVGLQAAQPPKPVKKPKPKTAANPGAKPKTAARSSAPQPASSMPAPAPAPMQDNAFPPPPPMQSPVEARFPAPPPQPAPPPIH